MTFNGSNRRKKEVDIDNSTLGFLTVLLAILLALVIATVTYYIIVKTTSPYFLNSSHENDKNDSSYPFKQDVSLSIALPDDDTVAIKGVNSGFAALVDLTDGKIEASKMSSSILYPASMTKVMTLIVVCENLESEASLDEVLEIKYPKGEHSGYGFAMGEKLTVRDLIYASILQSDGVACLTLADYIAGSEAAFVKMMNDKVKEMGLLDGDSASNPSTMFQNCTGMHDQYHYTTAYDIAYIMAYAMKNDFCANVLTTLKYTPSEHFRPGQGCVFWHNLIHEYLADGNSQPSNAKITGGKTGWTGNDSGNCIVAYARGNDGHEYVVVVAKALKSDTATGKENAKSDLFYICETYIK